MCLCCPRLQWLPSMLITAMRLVNSIEAVVAAEPGLVYAKDLPVITGRGLMAR